MRGGQRARGAAYSGRSNRDWATTQNVNQNGPLLTDHLRDLDKELELLNRRRQMIQQEHELLDREREYSLKRQYEYTQPMTSYNQPNYYNKQGNKRQALERAPSKAFNQLARVEPWEHNVQSNNPSFMKKIPPLLGSAPIAPPRPSFRTARPTPPVRNSFNASRVTKPKSRTSYLNKPSLTDPKNIQPKTKKVAPKPLLDLPKPVPGNAVPTVTSKDDDLYILRHNVKPSPQLNGRLELALGSILKDLKTEYSTYFSEITSSALSLRTLKQIIRKRIHSVMLNKKAGQMLDIVACYRVKYPAETDPELLQLAKDSHIYHIQALGITPIINSEHIQEFFKINLNKVLDKSVEKLLSRLQNMNANHDDEGFAKTLEEVVDLQDSNVDNSSQTTENKNNDTSKEIVTDDEIISDKINKAKSLLKFMEEVIDAKLPFVLTKHKKTLMSFIEADKEYNHSKADIFEATVKEVMSMAASKIEKMKSNILDDGILAKTKPNKEEVIAAVESTPSKTISNASPADIKTPLAKITDHPYFVKLIGRPELPSRASVYAYLEQFKPASIKKHKTINNLLVIGLNDKESYDKILEAGDVTIDESTITVKTSEKVSLTPQKQTPQEVKNTDSSSQEVKNDEAPNGVDKPIDDAVNKNDSLEDNKNEDIKENIENEDIELLDRSVSIGSDLEAEISSLINVCKESPTSKAAVPHTNGKEASDEVPRKGNETSQSDGMENIATEPTEQKSEDKQAEDKQVEDNQPVDTISNDNENINDEAENDVKDSENADIENEAKEEPAEMKAVKDLKETGRATPTRSSSRLASTPSTIKTRRASRLAQNQ